MPVLFNYKLRQISTVHKLALAGICAYLLFTSSTAFAAEPAAADAKVDVGMLESDDDRCVANDGKLISLESKNLSVNLVVWVDRWFMGVQTADHTKLILTKDTNPVALGCSNTYSGPQRWTIYSVSYMK